MYIHIFMYMYVCIPVEYPHRVRPFRIPGGALDAAHRPVGGTYSCINYIRALPSPGPSLCFELGLTLNLLFSV